MRPQLLVIRARRVPARRSQFLAALRLLDAARDLGFSRCRLAASHCTRSGSHYLDFEDAAGRAWRIRVGDHRRAERSARPHLDLVNRSDETVVAMGRAFLAEVAIGAAEWFDSPATARAPSAPKLRRIVR